MTFGYTNSAEWEPAKIWSTFSGSSRCLHSSGRKGAKQARKIYHWKGIQPPPWSACCIFSRLGAEGRKRPGKHFCIFPPPLLCKPHKTGNQLFQRITVRMPGFKMPSSTSSLAQPKHQAAQRVRILAKSAGHWACVRRWGKTQLGPVEHRLCGDDSFKGPFFFLL